MFTGKIRATVLVVLLLFAAAPPHSSVVRAADGRIGFTALSDGHWQIHTLDLADKSTRPITKTPWDKKEPSWFKKEAQLIYRTGNGTLHRFNQTTEEDSPLLAKYGPIFDPNLSPDDNYLVFTRFKTEILDDSDIWRFDFKLKNARCLTSLPKRQYDPPMVARRSTDRFCFIRKKGGRAYALDYE